MIITIPIWILKTLGIIIGLGILWLAFIGSIFIYGMSKR